MHIVIFLETRFDDTDLLFTISSRIYRQLVCIFVLFALLFCFHSPYIVFFFPRRLACIHIYFHICLVYIVASASPSCSRPLLCIHILFSQSSCLHCHLHVAILLSSSCLHMVLWAVAIRSVPLQLPLPDRVRRGVGGFPEHLPEVEGTHALLIQVFASALLVAVGGGRRSLLVRRVGTKHLAKLRGRLHVRGGWRTAPLAAGENQVTSGKKQVKRVESRSRGEGDRLREGGR